MTRSALSWSDLRGRRVGVWGLGREGMVNVRKLGSLEASLVLVDDRPGPVCVDGIPVLPTEAGGIEALASCDAVVKTPGISRYRPEVARLEQLGVPVTGGLGLWFQEARADRVVCVTGTKGKSSVVSIAGHLMTGLGYRCMVGGNIGQPPYDPETEAEPWEYWVIEVSSYQAMDLASSPPVVGVTSLHPDHVPWHAGVENYFRDKLSLCSQPGADLTIANGDSDLIRERSGLLGPRVEWVYAADEPGATWMRPLGLLGEHNRRNALIARRCLIALGIREAGDDAAMDKAAHGYQPLPSRLQIIGDVHGVTFVDDSLSTNVLPTVAALEAFDGKRVALIVGGQDRGIDYTPLAVALHQRSAPTYLLTLPESGPRIHADVEAAKRDAGRHVSALAGATDCPDLAAAVATGFRWAEPDGVVLLSPAAPSFGVFKDYRDRAEAFARAVRTLT